NYNGIHVDPSKIKAVKNWKAPKTPSEIQSFQGLAGYYRRVIANFSKIVKPLTSLTQKNQKYEWGVEQEEAFHTLKDNLCNAPILSLHDGAEDFVVYCDASNQGLGCVLMQRGKANIVVDALSKKERVKPKRVQELSMRIQSGIKEKLTMIMDDAYATRYSIPPRADKMYYDLRDMYWWPVDRLTKSAHFLAIREDYSMEKLSRLYIDEIVKALGTRLDMSTAYHPQTDGQSERTIQSLEDMLRACVIDFGGSWDTHLPLAEFSYNNSYHSSIRCAPFKALYGRKCRYGSRRKELNGIHDTFHVSNLKKCLAYASLRVLLEEIRVDKTLCFVEERVEIMDREVKKLKRSRITIVKVSWNSKHGPKYTWEREDFMKSKYPNLFAKRVDKTN
ncbi:putative reverse transcriptase domain-containing protein, partial [Tanacetum coccineum]